MVFGGLCLDVETQTQAVLYEGHPHDVGRSATGLGRRKHQPWAVGLAVAPEVPTCMMGAMSLRARRVTAGSHLNVFSQSTFSFCT